MNSNNSNKDHNSSIISDKSNSSNLNNFTSLKDNSLSLKREKSKDPNFKKCKDFEDSKSDSEENSIKNIK
jgi:hypothetical protein